MTATEKKFADAVAAVRPTPRRSRSRKVFRWAEHLLACVGLIYLVYHLAFEITAMTSDSMAPTLQGTSYENGDRIVLERVTGWFRAPKRWEIYHYYDDDGNPVTKRIVGLPKEKISLKNHRLYINGVELQKPEEIKSLKYYDYGNLANGREVDCGNGYFMLGDASVDSHDSRYTGPVSKERFRGRVWCIIWPYAQMGFVK